MIRDLEEALGNHYSIMSKEFQLAYIRIGFFHLRKENALTFDVAPAGMKIQPSCKAVGIFGNLTGNRATHIIADDIETSGIYFRANIMNAK